MRDPGLSEAIRAAGGVSELARQIGISQPSVSNWIRVPAERVVSVETATGVDRAVLRPDLYGSAEVDDVDTARAQEYALLAALLMRAPDASLLSKLSALRGDASPLGLAHAALAEAAERTTVEKIEREYFELFIGLGRGELMPYGSYYSDRVPARTSAGSLARRPFAHRDRAGGRHRRAGRPCRYSLRDHVWPCQPPASRTIRFRSLDLRKTHGALGSVVSLPTWKTLTAADFSQALGTHRSCPTLRYETKNWFDMPA